MSIKIRNRNYWTPTRIDIVEDIGKGTIFENPYKKRPKRKQRDQYKEYLLELSLNSPEWSKIFELQKIYEKNHHINLLCDYYPDPTHATIIQKAIRWKNTTSTKR
jgi:hypothetical protein